MKKAITAGLAALTLQAFSIIASAQQPPRDAPTPVSHVKTEAIIMLQSDAQLGQRASNVSDVGLYLKHVQEAFAKSYETIDTPETISAVVALKPVNKAKLWIVSSLPNPPDRGELIKRFDAVPVPEVKEGPLAFAIRLTVAGGGREKTPLLPPEWSAAFGGQKVMMPDAITTYIWKD